MIWLENHNFHALTERIYESEELQRNLHEILAGTLEKIDYRLELLATAVAEVSLKIDGLRDISRAISTDIGGLSTQACEILKLFAESNDSTGMTIFSSHQAKILFMIPNGGSYAMDDQRFIMDDLAALAAAGLIAHTDHTGSGEPIYSLTRKGGDFAKSLPAVHIRS